MVFHTPVSVVGIEAPTYTHTHTYKPTQNSPNWHWRGFLCPVFVLIDTQIAEKQKKKKNVVVDISTTTLLKL